LSGANSIISKHTTPPQPREATDQQPPKRAFVRRQFRLGTAAKDMAEVIE
jgi:hypothetical protein